MSIIKNIYHLLNPKFQSLFMEYKVDFKPRNLESNTPLYEIINKNRDIYKNYLNKFIENKDVFLSIKQDKEETDVKLPGWNNGFLPGLDIIALYGIIKIIKPTQYVEIGSGNSTKVAYKSIKDNDFNTKITSVDPFPRAECDVLSNKIIRKPFEKSDFSFLFALKENDILFIDNSHRVLPNSDAMVFFLEVLPKLQKGVIVHIHDIYLPYDYPQFMCDRFYNEQYMLAAFLLANPQKFNVLMPNFFVSEDKELSQILNPIWDDIKMKSVEKHGGSFWFQIN